ncbi:hypothetical protein ABPG75_008794 [Micractinium tetrahymenae]
MAFWGCEVKPGSKPTPFVPPPTEGGHAPRLHLSQACLSTKAKPGTKAALRVRVSEEGEPLLVCVLREGGTESAGLDLIFDQYTEFSVEGGAPIHLTGYYMPEFETGEEETDEEEGDFPPGQLLGYDEYGMPVLADEYDSEEDSDYETEESDEDEEMGSGDEDGDLDPPRRVVIEDVTEFEGRERKALPAPESANGKRAAADDDEESEEEEGSDEEEEEGSEEEEEEESEEEQPAQQAAPKQQQKQQQQQAAAGQKRKADQQPAEQQPAKKEAKQQAAAAATPAGKQQQGAAAAATAEKQQKQQQQQQQQKGKDAAATPAAKSKVRTFPNGFEIEDLKQGRPDGKLAKAGKKVLMRYVGRLKSNGKVFDQTKGNATFSFRLGVGEVIKGWDRGVEGMRVGDKRRLTIPPQMAYGTSGVKGAIPPNAWLVFDVELVDVK